MAPRSGHHDPRFPSLTLSFLVIYFVVAFVTLFMSFLTMGFQIWWYRHSCANGTCLSGDLVVFIIGCITSVLALIQSVAQIRLYRAEKLSPLILLYLNTVIFTLWIIVLVIGWSSERWWWDDEGKYHAIVTGWLLQYANDYKYWSVSGGVASRICIAMGFIVMSNISFSYTVLMAGYAFVVHHYNEQRPVEVGEESVPAVGQLVDVEQ